MVSDFMRTIQGLFSWVATVLPLGWKMAGKVFAASVVCFLLGMFFWGPFFFFFCKIGLILTVFILFFFRNPVREVLFTEDEIASPADGTIISIQEENNPNVVVIRIFLSIFNVHVQYSPISGSVTETVYTPGTFLFANNPEADTNERNLIRFASGPKQVAIEQITGAIARRIECWVEKGQPVISGENVGLIRFGSQVALYLPKEAVILTVKKGQKVQGGLSVIGRWK